jgi:hypothetical protein
MPVALQKSANLNETEIGRKDALKGPKTEVSILP